MASERRLDRMRDVLAARIHPVRCALEALHHRHNISAVLRTCDALGVHRVDLVEGPKFHASRGAARGAERWLDLRQHRSAADAIAAIRADGYRVWVADLSDTAVDPHHLPLDQPACVWFGAEHDGVSAAAAAAADGVVTVPMRGFAQSLNVSVAAALVLQVLADRARALPAPGLSPAEQAATLAAWLEREAAMERAIAARRSLQRQLDDAGGE